MIENEHCKYTCTPSTVVRCVVQCTLMLHMSRTSFCEMAFEFLSPEAIISNENRICLGFDSVSAARTIVHILNFLSELN